MRMAKFVAVFMLGCVFSTHALADTWTPVAHNPSEGTWYWLDGSAKIGPMSSGEHREVNVIELHVLPNGQQYESVVVTSLENCREGHGWIVTFHRNSQQRRGWNDVQFNGNTIADIEFRVECALAERLTGDTSLTANLP